MRINLLNRIVKFSSLLFFLYLLYRNSFKFNLDNLSNFYLKISPLLNLQIFLKINNFSLLIIPAVVIFLTLFFGRFFCGWICPVGAIFTFFEEIFLKRIKRLNLNFPSFKYYVLIFAIFSLFTSFPLIGILDPLCLITREATYVFSKKIPYFLIFLISLSFLSSFFWCKNLCPLGAIFSIFSYNSLFKLKITDKCVKCKRCKNICPTSAIDENNFSIKNNECILCFDCYQICKEKAIKFSKKKEIKRETKKINFLITRRNFLNLVFFSGIYILFYDFVKFTYKNSYLLRPPGAVKEEIFLERCIRCLKCIKICPTQTLTTCEFSDGISLIYTPKLVPELGGCELCMLCNKICPSGALIPITPDKVKIGTAIIERERCLAWSKNKLCLICMEVCPVGAISSFKIYPLVNKDKCVGCGVCEKNCPAEKKAIFVTPLGEKRLEIN
jgi:NapH/MauN family ferredoxin-type protein